MAENPGFPGGGFDFGYAEAGAALAGLVVRDVNGVPRSGIMPSVANLITGRSDWNVQVAPFVVVRGDGPRVLLGSVDESTQAVIAPAPASNSRIDLVYALARNVDAGDPAGCVHVVTGVPGAVPVKPALPAGGVELATVTVSATSTNTASATIVNSFKQTCAAGGVIPFRDAADRDAFSAVDGQRGSIGTAVFQCVNGAWVSVTPSVIVASVERAVSATQSGIAAAPVELTGMSIPLVLTDATKVRVTVSINTLSTTVSEAIEVLVRDEGTVLRKFTVPANSSPTAPGTTRNHLMSIQGITISPGSHRLNVAIQRVVGSGTVSSVTDGLQPSSMVIERL